MRWLPLVLIFAACASSAEPVAFRLPSARTGPHTHAVTTTTTTEAPKVRSQSQSHSHEVELGPAVQYDESDAAMVALIRSVFGRAGPRVADQAVRVSHCETAGTFDPTIRNPRSSASGLFQFLDGTWRRWGDARWPRAYLAPPDVQVEAAFRLWSARGWAPWVCRKVL